MGDDVDALAHYLADAVEDECPTCGAWMLNPQLHHDWHERLNVEVRKYREPPRYGGNP